jgi:sensor domain CHASE-containing protein
VETSLPPLKKPDDAWLTPNNNNDQWASRVLLLLAFLLVVLALVYLGY